MAAKLQVSPRQVRRAFGPEAVAVLAALRDHVQRHALRLDEQVGLIHRVTAQAADGLGRVEALEKLELHLLQGRLDNYRDRLDNLDGRQLNFERRGFFARFRWLLFGK